MKGIGEERLIAYKQSRKLNAHQSAFIDTMIDACEELNNWLPINENTPKDRPILLLTNDNIGIEGYFINLDGGYWVDGLYHDEIKPKAWQELPSMNK